MRSEHDAAAMVPDVLFYDNQQVGLSSTTNTTWGLYESYFLITQHLRVLEDMSRDFALGEHLLLVGNQGVGKNKIVDRFLYLLNLPREYLQLHRCVVYFISLFLMLLAFPFRACLHTFVIDDAGMIFLRNDFFINVSGFPFVRNGLFSFCYQLFFPGK